MRRRPIESTKGFVIQSLQLDRAVGGVAYLPHSWVESDEGRVEERGGLGEGVPACSEIGQTALICSDMGGSGAWIKVRKCDSGW